mgnify:CR=1 FL=1|tara:strand:- start:92 stop:562 length:471 start_codon:yes stop_codon:yes gene_type:complete
MAYQKLQAGRAFEINKTDETDIPNIMLTGPSGTSTTGSATLLIDTAATFLTNGVQVGMIIINTSDNTQTNVIGVENETTLTVSSNAFATTNKNYQIYGEQKEGCVLYIGTAGNIKVTTVGNDDVTFIGVNTGAFFPVQVKKVFATGTSADNIIALW